MTISIAISVHNRHEVSNISIEQWKKHLPDGAKLFIVDDGSDVPYPNADIRNETALGIAACKNQCIKLCEGSDYIILADDDVFPISSDWWKPYVESGLNHLCFTFSKYTNGKRSGRNQTGTFDNIAIYDLPCGCMNFYTKACFEAVGGMDIKYGKWSFEHVGHSQRIHNAGLTPFPFMDIAYSGELFYSFDQDNNVERTVDKRTRQALAQKNFLKYKKELKSKEFIPYG